MVKYFGLIAMSLLGLSLNLFAQQAGVEKPNIVLIYADDLGWVTTQVEILRPRT